MPVKSRARRVWVSRYRCPQCSASSEIHWSEDEDPWRSGDPNRHVDRIDAPLVAWREGPSTVTIKIYCGECGCAAE